MSFLFNGTTSVVNHGDIAALDAMTVGTWMFWLRYLTVSADGFLSKGVGTAAGNGWRIGTGVGSNNDISWRVANQGGRIPAVFPDTAWHHWAFVFNGGGVGNAARLQGYQDGVQRTLTYSGTVPASTGADNATSVLAMEVAAVRAHGIMGLVKIWRRALTAAQVRQESAMRRPNITDNLVLWAPYDDSVTAPNDYSGRGNIGAGTALAFDAGPPVSYGGD